MEKNAKICETFVLFCRRMAHVGFETCCQTAQPIMFG